MHPFPSSDPTRSGSSPRTGGPTDEALSELVRGLAELTGIHPQLAPPVIVGGSRTSGELALRPLTGPDPIGSVVGESAPDHWEALALIATGQSFTVAGPGPGGPRVRVGPPTGPVLLVHAVARGGHAVAAVQPFDGEIRLLPTAPGQPAGRVDDVLRRMLGLPTAPVHHDVAELWALRWLDAITAEHLDRGSAGPRAWPELTRLHPAVRRATIDPGPRSLTGDELARLGRAWAQLTGWSELRRLCARGRWTVEGITDQAAAWMDDGMFSRWVLQHYPLLDEYLVELEVILRPSVLAEVKATLAAWGLL